MLQAQIYTTSSQYSYSMAGVATPPSATPFRSTSSYMAGGSGINTSSYSTAPMRMATGSISTVASQLAGGVLAEECQMYHDEFSGPRRLPGAGGIAPPDTPIGDGWDVALLLVLLCAVYTFYIFRKRKSFKA